MMKHSKIQTIYDDTTYSKMLYQNIRTLDSKTEVSSIHKRYITVSCAMYYGFTMMQIMQFKIEPERTECNILHNTGYTRIHTAIYNII